MIENIGRYYLYRHIRLDTNDPFYIGISTKSSKQHNKVIGMYTRAYTKKGRTDAWKNIVNKTEYEVEILLESDDYEFIKQKEIEFIALYGRRDLGKGTLVNLTDGGDGAVGAIRSAEYIKNAKERSKFPVNFLIVDSEGSVHEGINIRNFCIEKKLSESLIYKMFVSGGSSQGYFANYEKYLENKIVIVNLRTKEVFHTTDPKKWTEENYPELLNSRGYPEYIYKLLAKKIKVYKDTWYACYFKDWEGCTYINLDRKNNKEFVIENREKERFTVTDIIKFCKEKELNISGFYDMLSKKRSHHKGYKLIKEEYVLKNINNDNTRINIS